MTCLRLSGAHLGALACNIRHRYVGDWAMEAPVVEVPRLETSQICSFDEYKLYYESTQQVIERRLALNRTNISLCLLVAASLGIILAWSYDKRDISHVALAAAAVISFMGVMFCRWWAKQITSFKALNSAKFKVLHAMAPKVVFSGVSDSVRSFSPFDREWEELKISGALQKYKGGYTLKTSELIIPRSFMYVYLGTLVFCVAWILHTNLSERLATSIQWIRHMLL